MEFVKQACCYITVQGTDTKKLYFFISNVYTNKNKFIFKVLLNTLDRTNLKDGFN